jgi:hypothetical protein
VRFDAHGELHQFDTLCNKGTITRTFRAFDCHGQSSQCTQRIVVNYEQDYYVRFPNDVIVIGMRRHRQLRRANVLRRRLRTVGRIVRRRNLHGSTRRLLQNRAYLEDHQLVHVQPELPLCINVPNPNPNATTNHPTNLPGPIVSPIQTVGDPWKSTIVKINPTTRLATNYSIFYDPNANCYTYKQIIKIIDTQDPIVAQCPASPVTICD